MTLPVNQFVQGDCVQVLKTLPSKSVDLVVTDPPYLVNYRPRSGRTIKNDGGSAAFLSAFPDIYRVLKPNSFCICFYGWSRLDEFFNAWRQAGFRPVGHIVWTKDYTSSARFLQCRHEQAYLLVKGNPDRPHKPLPDVQPWKYTGNKVHPTEKAVSILKPLVQSFSKPGDIVLDPFSGWAAPPLQPHCQDAGISGLNWRALIAAMPAPALPVLPTMQTGRLRNMTTNTIRAERAEAALRNYVQDKGEVYEASSSEITDLIADLLHLAASLDEGDDPVESTLRLARMHFDAEHENPEEQDGLA